MIHYSTHRLNNGLQVILHRDGTTPLITINTLVCAGSRDEQPSRTGFAHLFEHLMFGGTLQYPDYDHEVDSMGGENNAFTNTDYTNYYITVPAKYLNQALQLEADRLYGHWDIRNNHWPVLDVQKKVVTEEYNQRYLNQPYGDVWLHLRPLCYHNHPYRWCTIGADISHVQQATLNDVSDFFNRFYRPDNIILSIAGNFDQDEAIRAIEQLYGSLPPSSSPLPPPLLRNAIYPQEPIQSSPRFNTVCRPVPATALYMAWVMSDRFNEDFYVYDTISDILSNGQSSRLYQRLVQKQPIFSEINAYITGELSQGLFVISGKLRDGQDPSNAQAAVHAEIQHLISNPPSQSELDKVANKFENNFLFSQYKASDRAMSLCYYTMLGHTGWINYEPSRYRQIHPDQILRVASLLSPSRCNTLIIQPSNASTV